MPALTQDLTLVLTPFLWLHLGEKHTDHFPEWLSPQEQLQSPSISEKLTAMEQRQLY